MQPLRIGILSTANIARHLVSGIAGSDKVVAVAVASRSEEAARAFADANNVARALPDYEALLADPEVEAIYNPLPNTLHAEWSIRALEAGKHVLCEKPIGVSANEARAMFAAAERTGLHLVEAYPYRAQPQTQALAKLVHGGEIGRPRMIQAAFGFPLGAPDNIRLNPDLGGGALLDAGCYAVSLIHLLAGQQATRVSAEAIWSERGVDLTLVANLRFADGLLAQVACSFGTALYRRAIVACEQGVVQTDFLNHLTDADPGQLIVARGGWTVTRDEQAFARGSGFRAEAESFADLVRGTGPWTGITPVQSIEVMTLLDAIIASARAGGAPVDIA
ncbi:Gfo/Idh/MocA family protein [Sphingomonas jatrophae]|uniref:Predicted dehydrogenase n=1 Tax=Sphingomonas jatrophae TaxID=1166337 RepID=A0A1I6KAR8_9SPHN|nr:Gfo/Idh/MocA family oxidoreductase [Sphingomonas jatrophae]SFR88332.1 Predicted dehydrogenase [Sphingomonas jatrophae]